MGFSVSLKIIVFKRMNCTYTQYYSHGILPTYSDYSVCMLMMLRHNITIIILNYLDIIIISY